jgi:RHS repeat-associated protein
VSRVGSSASIFDPCCDGCCKTAATEEKIDDNFDPKKLEQRQKSDLQYILDKAKLALVSFKEYKPITYEEAEKATKDDLQETDAVKNPTDKAPTITPIYFYHPDHLGTSTFLTDANGAAYQFFLNLPFGETMAEQRPSTYFATNYKFNGKELDEETGLYYYGARYYDPRISIWYSVDPLAEKYPGVNPYVYCLQNPVNMIDPDGRDVIFWYVTHLEPITNYPIYDKKHVLSRDFAFTMTSIMRTNTGKDYISQFMKKDQTLFGITAEKNGKYSDVNLNIVQYDLKGDDQAKSGIIFSDKDGVTTVTEVNGKLMINIYVRSMNPSPDDICHEIFVHNASQIKQIVDAYKKGGIKAVQAILTSADIDHIALRDLDIKHKGIEKYKKISDELSKNPVFKEIFEKNTEVNKRKYEGLEKK